MQREVACAMWFQTIDSIGDRTLFALRKRFGSMQEAYEASEDEWKSIFSEKQFLSVVKAKRSISPQDAIDKLSQKGIRYVPYFEEVFPTKLLHIPSPPFGIFVKGSLPDEGKPSAAMIGTRACSDYGKEVAAFFAQQLANYGVQIVSGMARGIDSISQANCLKAGGQTFAVLGCGVDVCYPGELRQLYTDISKQGGIISTYAPGAQPKAGCFPARNRIISALSDVVLVIEAGVKSGTLITVDMALEQGKEVAIIPGRITDKLSQGCLKLLKQGASMVIDTEELLELLKHNFYIEPHITKNNFGKYNSNGNGIDFNKNISLSEEMKSVFELLTNEPKEAEKLYELWLKNGASGEFYSFMEMLMDLELMDLCKSNKNRFSIR